MRTKKKDERDEVVVANTLKRLSANELMAVQKRDARENHGRRKKPYNKLHSDVSAIRSFRAFFPFVFFLFLSTSQLLSDARKNFSSAKCPKHNANKLQPSVFSAFISLKYNKRKEEKRARAKRDEDMRTMSLKMNVDCGISGSAVEENCPFLGTKKRGKSAKVVRG